MPEREGVIKFQLSHRESPPLHAEGLGELIAWRRILFQLQLIGQDPGRYGGYGFGNISRRIAPFDSSGRRPFVITGTQTGNCSELGPEHFALVTECVPEHNSVTSQGPIKPSSEAMTHATLYALDAELRVVMHVHSPHIWQSAAKLELPVTPVTAAYGTTAMTAAVTETLSDPVVRRGGLLVMGGHEDGVVAFGPTADQAGLVLMKALAQSYHPFQFKLD